jgi:hypothetical protein
MFSVRGNAGLIHSVGIDGSGLFAMHALSPLERHYHSKHFELTENNLLDAKTKGLRQNFI